MIDFTSNVGVGTLVVGLATAGYFVFFWRSYDAKRQNQVPLAPGSVSFVGHALSYRKNSPAFLRQCQAAVGGGVFGINLAGRRMVVIGSDATAHRQVAMTAETTLSARRAIADIGFHYMLGQRSVHLGTDFHKRCLKDQVIPHLDGAFGAVLARELNCSVIWEIERLTQAQLAASATTNVDEIRIPDLFQFLRRCFFCSNRFSDFGFC